MISTLYIIGNGFDIHHGIRSNYSDFGKFLAAHDKETFDLVGKYLAFDDDFWSDFESRLADFDAASLIEDASDFLVSYAADHWRESYNHDYQFEISRVVEALSVNMKARFADWIAQLSVPPRSEIEDKLVRLDPDATFINFNYTPSLGKLYGVADSHILHIHGSSKMASDGLVLGHGWNPKEKGSLNKRTNFEETDTREIEGNYIVDEYFKATFKPTSDIILSNRSFFESLSSLERIFVMGHSLADVDLPYFREIIRNIHASNVIWKVSYYSDLTGIQRQFSQLAVDDALVEFAHLQDF
jgi:hypothetical protein